MTKWRKTDGSGWSDVDRQTAERLLRGERPTKADGPAAAALDRLLSAAAGPVEVDPVRAREQEAAALAAFRAAHAGETSARARREDWCSRARRAVPGRGRTGRTVIGALVAAVALGGVAAAGTGVLPTPFHFGPGPGTPAPAPGSTLPQPSTGKSSVPPGSPSHPWGTWNATPTSPGASSSQAKQVPGKSASRAVEGLCQAYAAGRGGQGAALDAKAFERLARAAGGEEAVDGYCAALGYERKKPDPAAGRDGSAAPPPDVVKGGDKEQRGD
jgi:hypothetical protein